MNGASPAPRLIELGYRCDLLDSRLGVAIDHCRWIAAAAVAAAHLRNGLLPDAAPGLPLLARPFYFITLFGTQSVLVFFVLSGLLVAGSTLARVREARFAASDYAVDRATRLFVVLVPAILLSVLLARSGLSQTCPRQDGAGLIFANLAFLQNLTVEPLCNNHPLWSLSSEGFFYLAGPALLLVVLRGWRVAWLCLALCVALAIIGWRPRSTTIGFGFLLWLIGLVPFFVKVNIRPAILLLPFLAVACASRVRLLPLDFVNDTALALTFALFLSASFGPRRVATRADRWAAKLAGFSYSLYLVHMPLLQAFGHGLGAPLDPRRGSSYAIYAACAVVIVVVAWLFGWAFERRTAIVRRWIMGPGHGIAITRQRA